MERHSEDLTQSGVTLGTFDYISPEQALEPREADARSDIYSLGCTFYHMLTGQPPVPEGTAAKKLHHHQHVAPVDPRQLNPEIPDEIAMMLSRMMAKEPRARYQRPLLLAQHLMQVAHKVGAADDMPEGVLFVDVPVPTAPRNRPVLMAALTFLALAVLITLVAINPSGSPPSVPPGPGIAAKVNSGGDKKGIAGQLEVPPPTAPVLPPAEDKVIRKPSDLAAVLQDAGLKDRHVIKLEGVINLSTLTLRLPSRMN